MSVSEVLLHYLEIEGVRKIFGVPGAATMDVQYQMHKRRDTFEFIVCRQESGAVYMADAYARATGGLGVVLVTSGPGAAAALTGTTNAEADGTPLLTITGEIGEAFSGKGYLQAGIDGRLNIDEIYAAATDYSAVITSPANARTLIEQALRDARGLPHHAAHLSLPLDVSKAVLSSVDVAALPASYRTTAASADPAGAKRMFEELLRASYPLIMLGNGCREVLRGNRLTRFESFVTKFGIPVITSPEGKGVFPEGHQWSLRNFGMVPCEWPAYYLNPSLTDPALPAKFDALAVFASELSEWGTQMWSPLLAPAGPFMQVDLDPSGIGRGYPVDLGIVAEAGNVIDELCLLGEQTAPDPDTVARRTAFVARIKGRSPWSDADARTSTASPMMPQALMRLIGDLTPDGSYVLIDCGNSVGWGLHHLVIDPPTEFHIALNVAPMGVAVAGVIGARIGKPLATCLAVVGDGAFMMHGNEISTAATKDVGAIWIVLDDNNLNMVNQGMDHFYPDLDWTNYYQFNHPDLAMFARSLGADAYDVSSPAEFQPAYIEAIRKANADNKPQVIIARIDASVVPPFYAHTSPAPPAPPAPLDRTFINPSGAPPAGPYNEGVRVGNTIYVSGQGAIDSSGTPVLGSFEDQATLTFENVRAVLTAGGATMADVVMVNIKLANTADFPKLNAIYTRYFPADFPARCTAGANLLFGLAIEVDCLAVVPP